MELLVQASSVNPSGKLVVVQGTGYFKRSRTDELLPSWSLISRGDTVNKCKIYAMSDHDNWHRKMKQGNWVALLVKNLPASVGYMRDSGLIPGSGRYLGGGHSDPLQYSCLENLRDSGTWWATIHRVTKSQTWLSDLAHTQQAGICNAWLVTKNLLRLSFVEAL